MNIERKTHEKERREKREEEKDHPSGDVKAGMPFLCLFTTFVQWLNSHRTLSILAPTNGLLKLSHSSLMVLETTNMWIPLNSPLFPWEKKKKENKEKRSEKEREEEESE